MSALPNPFPTAAELLRRAHVEGVAIWREGERVRFAASRPPASDLLDGLRRAKAEVLALLSGERCRFCAGPLDWSGPGAIPFADRSAAHLTCADRAEVARLLAAGRRAVESPDALSDPAEVTLRGEELP